MEPLLELLNRIRWDRSFGAGTFELGVYDRVEDQVQRVPLAKARFELGNSFSFFLEDSDGQAHIVPLHRVREVFKDGTLIWKREGREVGHPGG